MSQGTNDGVNRRIGRRGYDHDEEAGDDWGLVDDGVTSGEDDNRGRDGYIVKGVTVALDMKRPNP